MPFERPTLPELIDQGASELESRLPGVLARVRRSLVGVINRVVAGGLSALYKYAEFLNRQAWPDLAEGDYLDDHGSRWGIPRTPAAPATGTVRFTGVDGTAIPIGTSVQRADGQGYLTTVVGAIAAGQAIVAVQAVTAGQASNAAVNSALTLSSPLAGVAAAATAYTELSGGADIEADEEYRSRILARIRKPPQGGCHDDYIEWAKQVPGVTRVWVYPGEQGPASVVVRFTRDDDLAGAIPDAGEVAAVQAHLDPLRPVTAALTVVAPIADPLNFTIAALPNTAAVRAAVQAELTDLIRREAEPGGTLLLSHLREAVSTSAGEFDHNMTVPAANVVSPAGHISTMGVITWL
jgi:uncharacterized phage protein gp47/JayE